MRSAHHPTFLNALHHHLRARIDAGEALLVSDDDRSRVEEAIRELAVAGRELAIPTDIMQTFHIPAGMLDEHRERPTNRAMRRARRNR